MQPIFTRSAVRLTPMRLAGPTDAHWNVMMVPGGPGIGAESLAGLADCLPGNVNAWGVDLPGDGSNVQSEPYALWPGVLLEAASYLPNTIMLGHSTGGEYILAVPGIERFAAGIVLVSTAPDASWMPLFERMCLEHPLSGYAQALSAYSADPNLETLTALCVASAPWNAHTPDGLVRVTDLLGRMPYNAQSVAWSDANFDRNYKASWFPKETPTLILSGVQDRIVAQHLWDQPAYRAPHVCHARIEQAGHWPWLDQQAAVSAALGRYIQSLK